MEQSDIIEFYDAVAEEVANEWYDNQSLLPTIREFCTYLPEQPRVLDLGCGPGHEAARLHAQGAEILGIDISKQSILIARKRNPGCEFLEADFMDIDGSIGRFDGIFSAGSLIHMPFDQLKVAVKTITSVLKPGGYILIIFQEGTENKTHYPTIGNRKIERIIFRFPVDSFDILTVFENADTGFVKEISLHKELSRNDWKAMLFRKYGQPT